MPRADAQLKVTHCALINGGLIARIKALEAIPALFTTYAYYKRGRRNLRPRVPEVVTKM